MTIYELYGKVKNSNFYKYMNYKQILNLMFSKQNKSILKIVGFVLLLTLLLTVFQPLEYGAKSRLLIVQNNSSLDPYSASKANEYLGNVLSKVVVSSSFYDDVMGAGFNIDKNYFTDDARKIAKKWQKTVEAKNEADLGVIDIAVYHTDKLQAEQIAQAINYILKNESNKYHSAGDNISIKVIDQPLVSSWPVRPDLILNFGMALFLGLAIGYLNNYLSNINKTVLHKEIKIQEPLEKAFTVDYNMQKEPEIPFLNDRQEKITMLEKEEEKRSAPEKPDYDNQYVFEGSKDIVVGDIKNILESY